MKQILTVLILAILLMGAFSMGSCKKCATCSYTYKTAGGTELLTYTYPELCGYNSDINDYEDICATAAAAYGNTCTCTEN